MPYDRLAASVAPEPLALGRVFIRYRTEDLRVAPVFGKGAVEVSPRIGHIHIAKGGKFWPMVGRPPTRSECSTI